MKSKLIAFLALFLLSGCSERWEGFVYPNRENLSNFIVTGRFDTLDDCRASSMDILKKLKIRNGDYECGKNCQGSVGDSIIGKARMCERTER